MSLYDDYCGSKLYNNLVVSYEKTGASVVLFKERFGIVEYELTEEGGRHFIVGRGCDKDSNKDKLLNSQDLQKVFVYNVSEQKLSFVDMPANYGAIKIYSQNNLEMQLCKFGVNRNEDGEYDDLQEPAMIMKIDLLEAKLQSFVSEENVETIQNVLEGK